ncbi:hypothetical protein [Wohlfahrtiimonas larvae]|uniref:LemA family protein n=1 Tax=Wohlfahrtiimonas larvae TaxID=1157986 RepID=A0ABP9MHT5_9GAMM|nr:hypothetical protein [Wohlfahrtiimonas larvae]
MLLITIIFMIMLVVYIGITIFYIHHKIINLRSYAEKAYANIDVLLLKRAELVPQLLVLDQRESAQMKELMNALLIQQSINSKVEVHNKMHDLLKNCAVINNGHQQLMHLNAGIAHRVTIYNESVLLYNSCFKAFPYSYFMKILNLLPMAALREFS